MNVQAIDAHQHFWKYHPVRDHWISDKMDILKRDFLPDHLAPLLRDNNMSGCIAVQANETDEETIFLLDLAAKFDFIKGVVGWIDLESPDIERKLETYAKDRKLKGFRHMLQSQQQRDGMLRPAFIRGIGLLEQYNFTYDFIILPDQLPYAATLAAAFPTQRFVIDHLAKPAIKTGDIHQWKTAMLRIAKCKNVYCKLSGLVTEADWHNWKKEALYPYFDFIVKTFGTDRIMFGSDWPVCLLAAGYDEVTDLALHYFSAFSETEQRLFFQQNAERFYHL